MLGSDELLVFRCGSSDPPLVTDLRRLVFCRFSTVCHSSSSPACSLIAAELSSATLAGLLDCAALAGSLLLLPAAFTFSLAAAGSGRPGMWRAGRQGEPGLTERSTRAAVTTNLRFFLD